MMSPVVAANPQPARCPCLCGSGPRPGFRATAVVRPTPCHRPTGRRPGSPHGCRRGGRRTRAGDSALRSAPGSRPTLKVRASPLAAGQGGTRPWALPTRAVSARLTLPTHPARPKLVAGQRAARRSEQAGFDGWIRSWSVVANAARPMTRAGVCSPVRVAPAGHSRLATRSSTLEDRSGVRTALRRMPRRPRYRSRTRRSREGTSPQLHAPT